MVLETHDMSKLETDRVASWSWPAVTLGSSAPLLPAPWWGPGASSLFPQNLEEPLAGVVPMFAGGAKVDLCKAGTAVLTVQRGAARFPGREARSIENRGGSQDQQLPL